MYQRINDAWVSMDDGKLYVHVAIDRIANIILTPDDIYQAASDHGVRVHDTWASYTMLCKHIMNKPVDIDMMGGHEDSLADAIKGAQKMSSSKTIKVEFKVRKLASQRNIDVVDWSDAKTVEIQEQVGKDFKGFCSVKPGDKDKDDEVSLVASITKYTPKNESDFYKDIATIAKLLNEPDQYEYIEHQVKE